jgi:hemoglobin
MPRHDTISEASIETLIDRFYARVRQDELLGPVFARAIADDAWPVHIAIIRDFWSSVLLKTGRYHRNPFRVHQGIEGLSPAMFTRWLALFGEICREVFAPEAAEQIVAKAELIGRSLQAGLFFDPQSPVSQTR